MKNLLLLTIIPTLLTAFEPNDRIGHKFSTYESPSRPEREPITVSGELLFLKPTRSTYNLQLGYRVGAETEHFTTNWDLAANYTFWKYETQIYHDITLTSRWHNVELYLAQAHSPKKNLTIKSAIGLDFATHNLANNYYHLRLNYLGPLVGVRANYAVSSDIDLFSSLSTSFLVRQARYDGNRYNFAPASKIKLGSQLQIPLPSSKTDLHLSVGYEAQFWWYNFTNIRTIFDPLIIHGLGIEAKFDF